jgi:hypothetical protein
MHGGVKDVLGFCVEVSSRLRCASPGDLIVIGARAAVSDSLSLFGIRRALDGVSTGAFSRFMLYLNQPIHVDAGGLRGTFPFVASLRQAVLENMSLGLALSVIEVGR